MRSRLGLMAVLVTVILASGVGGAAGLVANGAPAPELVPGGAWINSQPLTMQALRGRVVLVEFWTYG